MKYGKSASCKMYCSTLTFKLFFVYLCHTKNIKRWWLLLLPPPLAKKFMTLLYDKGIHQTGVKKFLLAHCMQFALLYYQKNFLASMEVTEAAEATEAKKFQKLSMPQNAQNFLIWREKQKKIFAHYKFSKASWPSVIRSKRPKRPKSDLHGSNPKKIKLMAFSCSVSKVKDFKIQSNVHIYIAKQSLWGLPLGLKFQIHLMQCNSQNKTCSESYTKVKLLTYFIANYI